MKQKSQSTFAIRLPSFQLTPCCSGASKVGPPLRLQPAGLGEPRSYVVPPGRCQLGAEWTTCYLLAKRQVSATTSAFTFGLPNAAKPLNLATCACILARGVVTEDDGTTLAVRPYTPISTNCEIGIFVLLVKQYPGGKLSEQMHRLPIGDGLEFKHVEQNVKVQYPFCAPRIGMIAGGTGITPMVQALHALLGTKGDDTQVSMVFAARTADELLGKEGLDEWMATSNKRFSIEYILSNEPLKSAWKGERGRVSRALLERMLPPPDSPCLIFVCGPPGMYAALCGPRGEPELTGLLAELGYRKECVYKF